MIWLIFILYFMAFEVFTLLTKEKYYPSLSRWTWRKTSWQIVIGDEDGIVFTFRPLRILLFIGMSWATIHLSFGECAFGIC